MKTPEQIAYEIVQKFAWTGNVMRHGQMIGQQHAVAQEIAIAISLERERYEIAKSALCTSAEALAGVRSGRLRPGGKKVPAAFDNTLSAIDLAEALGRVS